MIIADYAAVDAGYLRECVGGHSGSALCRHSERYPAGLHDLSDAPSVLHVHGDVDRLCGARGRASVAIVGARKASDDGRETPASSAAGCRPPA